MEPSTDADFKNSPWVGNSLGLTGLVILGMTKVIAGYYQPTNGTMLHCKRLWKPCCMLFWCPFDARIIEYHRRNQVMHRLAHVALKINSHVATIPPQAQLAQAVAERDRMIEAHRGAGGSIDGGGDQGTPGKIIADQWEIMVINGDWYGNLYGNEGQFNGLIMINYDEWKIMEISWTF